LCERHPGAGRSRLLRPRSSQLLRPCDLRRSGPDLLRPRAQLRQLQQRLQPLLQAQVLPRQVPSPPVLQAQVLPFQLLQFGPELLRSGPDLRRSGCPDLRCSDVRRSGPLLQLVT
jgi:hypothetical protein